VATLMFKLLGSNYMLTDLKLW